MADFDTRYRVGASARQLVCAVLAFFACSVIGLSPLHAQSDGVQSLDQMMDEVSEENEDLADDGPADGDEADGKSDAAPSESTSGDGSIKSMDEMMGEVAEENDMELSDSPADSESSADDGQAEGPQKLPGPDPESDQNEKDEAEGSSWGFTLGLVGMMVALILFGAPLYILIGAVGSYLLVYSSLQHDFADLTILVEETLDLAAEPVLLAIPFFVVAGALMTEGDIAERLIDIAEAIFGQAPGGLAISTVFACAIFAAISGSSPVTVIAIGTIMYPVLVDNEYPDDFSIGLVTSAGSLGILIPPSIPMIVYGVYDPTGMRDPAGYEVVGTDGGVAELFIAGVGPGVLIGTVLSAYALFVGYRAGVETTDFDWGKLWQATRRGIWALLLPGLILGGIYTGLFTPTQAAAVSVVYAAVVEFFIHESLTLDDIPDVLVESSTLMGTIFIIMAAALGFNEYLVEAQIPSRAAEAIMAMDLGIFQFLLILNVLLLAVGFFMDILSAILILVPLLSRIALELGIHPLHLAVIFIVNLEIGYLTPPIGINLFVAQAVFDKSLGKVIRSVIPFMLLMLSCLMVVTYVPTLSLGLVKLSKGNGFFVGFPEAPETAPADPGGDSSGSGDSDGSTPSSNKSDGSGSESDRGDDGSGDKSGDVQSMDQMMDEVADEEGLDSDSESDSSDDGGHDGSIKSMDEMMKEVEEETELGDDSGSADPPPD